MNTKFHIRTFGCQMNERDSEYVTGLLLDSGFRKADSVADADVVIFNSCSVRKRAEDRLFSNIGDMVKVKREKPGLIVGLMGCTAQSFKAGAFERAPVLDFVCGTGNEGDIPEILKGIIKDRCRVLAAEKVNAKKPEIPSKYRSEAFKAQVLIGEGCNNFCSYCIVPYVRGRERSRELKDIVREVEGLAARGFKEITLLGQNVNSYANDERRKTNDGFIRLLKSLNSIKGIERIRFMTSHPKDASAELFRAMRDLKKVCEHLHLPLQSGSDRILKLMNRGYTLKKYMKLVSDYRKILPGGSITSDVVVGFPSETEKDFKGTLDAIREALFDSMYTFKYSPRPPAKSCKLKDNVTDGVKEKRLKTIMDIQCKMSEDNNRALAGKVMEVLVDGPGRKDPHKLTGRTRTNKMVVFDGPRRSIGGLVNVSIESFSPYALKGRIV